MASQGLPTWMQEPGTSPPLDETVEMQVVNKESLSKGVIGIDLTSVKGDEAPDWEPGAHVDIHLPGEMIRQYSLCGSPDNRESLRIAVLREEGGRGGSRYLHDIALEGDVVKVGRPRNNFRLKPSPRYLFIAGGIGITPLIPMIAAADAAQADWSLLYGGRTLDSMAFLPELEADQRVTVVPQDTMGLLDLGAALGEPLPDTLVYCCGPEPLIEAVEAACSHWLAETLNVERFKPRGDLPDGDGTAFEVVLDRSGMTLEIGPGETILDAVAAAGIPAPSSCREGTCGTCETVVLEGEPEHRDSVLTPADRAAGDCMMICCSRCRGDRLVLDL